MAKFEFEMKLQGFELKIKGDREDMPRINSEIGKHLAAVMTPPAHLIEEPVRRQVDATVIPTDTGNGSGRGKGKGKGKSSGGNGASSAAVEPVAWQHDPSKWGMPSQKWKAGQKVLWLLYVIKNEAGPTELSAATIAETFNAKFKQFGVLKRTSMPSILGSLKTSVPSLLMDDTTKTPNLWFLSEEGTKAAERLVAEAKTPSDAGNA